MKSVIGNVHGVDFVNDESAITSLKCNNCAVPEVDRIIFNIGKKTYPKRDADGKTVKNDDGKIVYNESVDCLATIVYFNDETKVAVINSEHDGVQFEDHKLSDGRIVKVATHESKERGVIYAIMKRICSKPNADGKMVDAGLSRILNEMVNSAYDTAIQSAELKIAKAKSKAEHIARETAAKQNGPKVRYSIAGTLERINKMLDKVDAGDKSVLKSFVDGLKA